MLLELLLWVDFTIEPDYKPLDNKDFINIAARIKGFHMGLMRYKYRICYDPGKELYKADTLSRATSRNV